MTLGISRIFRSTDAGAPVFNSNVAGSLNNVLKAVLVNGYGSTQSLGWTLEYDTSNIAVFRPKAGTRMYIRFNDTDYNSLNHAEVSAFSTMSSINNGTERIPMVGTYAFIQKQFSTTSSTVPWIIVGDDAGFWLFYRYMGTYGITYNNRFCAVYFGDYNVWDIRNKWNFILLATNGLNPPSINSISEGLRPHGITTSFKSLVARGYDFNLGCKYVGIVGGVNINASYFGRNTFNASFAYPYSMVNGVHIGCPIRIFDAVTPPTTRPIILGSLPGVLDPFSDHPIVNDAITLANTQHIEYVDSDGELSIFMFLLNGSLYVDAVDKILVKVGKGFRNVQ